MLKIIQIVTHHNIHPLDSQPAFQKPALSESAKCNLIKRHESWRVEISFHLDVACKVLHYKSLCEFDHGR